MTVASSKPKSSTTPHDKRLRIARANQFIRVIAAHGRHFLSHNGEAGYLFLDPQSRIRYHDPYTKKDVYTYGCHWKGFTEGGTMQRVIHCLRQYIQGILPTGEALIMSLPLYQNRPSDIFPDHPWGYGDDMRIVISEASRIFTCSE